MIRLNHSRYIHIRNFQPAGGTELFFGIRGPRTKNILVVRNDLSDVKSIVCKAVDVPESALVLKANYPSQE